MELGKQLALGHAELQIAALSPDEVGETDEPWPELGRQTSGCGAGF
jgi:hypothetical protein